jgi:hypothetical protein
MPEIDYTSALGQVTRAFQNLEYYFSVFAWGLMGKDQRIGQTITAHLSFSKLLTLVETLFRLRTSDSALIDHMSAIIGQAAEAEQHRNRVTHSAYLQMSDEPGVRLIRHKITARLKKGLVHQWEEISIDDLITISVELTQTSELLVAFIGRVREPLRIDFSGYDGKDEAAQTESKEHNDVPF